jgi:hypothetical protein
MTPRSRHVRNLSVFLAILGSAALFVPACNGGDETHEHETVEECEALGEMCHGLNEPLADECHEIGHDGDADVCLEREEECLAHCMQVAAAGGAGGHGGADDH